MRKVKATDPSLRKFAVRGVGAVRPGRELVVVHSGNGFARRVTPQTDAQYLAHRFHDLKYKVKDSSNPYWDEQDWMFHTANGSGQYLSDMGLVPYGKGGYYNEHNYTLDPAHLLTLDIELEV